jgi:hypothetical protein
MAHGLSGFFGPRRAFLLRAQFRSVRITRIATARPIRIPAKTAAVTAVKRRSQLVSSSVGITHWPPPIATSRSANVNAFAAVARRAVACRVFPSLLAPCWARRILAISMYLTGVFHSCSPELCDTILKRQTVWPIGANRRSRRTSDPGQPFRKLQSLDSSLATSSEPLEVKWLCRKHHREEHLHPAGPRQG